MDSRVCVYVCVCCSGIVTGVPSVPETLLTLRQGGTVEEKVNKYQRARPGPSCLSPYFPDARHMAGTLKTCEVYKKG